MRTVFLSKSLSRKAGGLLPVMQKTGETLHGTYNVDVHAFGGIDECSDKDAGTWRDVVPRSFAGVGPAAFGFSWEMVRAVAALRPDLLHTHGLFYFTSAVAAYLSHKGYPYLVTPHGMLDEWALKNSRWKKLIFTLFFEKHHLTRSSCIHSLCDAETKAIYEFGCKGKAICQIPNGVDLPKEDITYPAPWKEERGKKVLLFLSRIHPKKGLVNLLRGWRAVHDTHSEWMLAIAGWSGDNHDQQLKTLAQQLNICSSVVFLGPQFGRNKDACYQNADGFILPSFSEGLPMVILEAWSHAKPVLMTSACNLNDGFEASAAMKVSPSPEGIEQGLRDFFSLSESQRNSIGNNGLRLVEEKYTWEKVTSEMFLVYQWILGGGATPSCVVNN